MAEQLTSTRPYLLRAMHEWLSDNGQTPLIIVDAGVADVCVPEGYVKDGRIVLNIDWSATRNLQMDNVCISFEARFGGVSHRVSVPVAAVLGIYARQSGQGMWFQDESGAAQKIDSVPAAPARSDSRRSESAPLQGGNDDNDGRPPRGPGLRLVK